MDRRSFLAAVPLVAAAVRADRVTEGRREEQKRTPLGCEALHRQIEAKALLDGRTLYRCGACGAVFASGPRFGWFSVHSDGRIGRRLTRTRFGAMV